MTNAAALATHTDGLPVESFPWGTLQWLCSDRLSPGALQTVGLCRLFPGQRNPPHYHPNCEEVLHVLAGSGVHRVDGESVTLTTGSTIRIPAGVKHDFWNNGTEAILCLIAFSSGARETVFVE